MSAPSGLITLTTDFGHQGPFVGVGAANPNKSEFVLGFQLRAEDRRALLAFLASLTDETFLHDPRFSNPGG